MSRSAFARSHGAFSTNDRFAWSYVNHDQKFVIFGAWKEEFDGERQRIFSTDWSVDANGRRPNAFGASFRNIELVVEEGYGLFTFAQWRDPDLDGIPRIKGYEEKLTEMSLSIDGPDYFAIPLNDRAILEGNLPVDIFFEGVVSEVVQTKFERSGPARAKCIKHFGSSCHVCSIDFEKRFGELGKGFIHVHHKVPVSKRGSSYKVDPIRDLIPVCPNCHAMLHRENPPMSVEKLVALLHQRSEETCTA